MQRVGSCGPQFETEPNDKSHAWMEPRSLQKLCVDAICVHSKQICEKVICSADGELAEVDDFIGLQLPMHKVNLPPSISEELLSTLVKHRLLDDENFQIFNEQMHLETVDIMHAPVTLKGLQVLHRHTLSELRLRNIEARLDKIISNTVFNQRTEKSLRVLSLTSLNFTEQGDEKMRHSVHISAMADLAVAFTNLVSLSLVNIDLRDHGLKALCQNLSPTVTMLDISENPITDIAPVGLLAHSLQRLTICNICRLPNSNLKVLNIDLHELQHLDVSRFTDQQFDAILHGGSALLDMSLLLKPSVDTFKALTSLDISGWSLLNTGLIRRFLAAHRNVTFLGMALVEAADADVFQDASHPGYLHHLNLGSLVGEEKVLESCARYIHRPFFIQKCLLSLFQITKQCLRPRSDLIVLLVDIMTLHADHASVLMAATACLYNLTKNNLVLGLHAEYLKLMASAIIDCMQRFPCTEALQRNCLLTICSDKVLSEVTFDRYKCIELALECLCKFKDFTTTRMCLAVTSILAAKVPINAVSDLASNSKYMLRLIEITKEKAEILSTDGVIKFALSALWNLTDESPKACHCFSKLQGLELAVSCLTKYSRVAEEEERLQIQIKIVGLLNNIAEVPELRVNLITSSFLEVIRESLRSDNSEYAYFSGGILANLLCNLENPAWTHIDPSKVDHLQEEMISAISDWKQPESAMVAYRCFQVFCPLLAESAPSASQLWALWAINHVCRKDREKYVEMLHTGRVYQDVKRIAQSPGPCSLVRNLATSLHEFVAEVSLHDPPSS
ncbi:protein zyg-11 homolog B-like isoform X2 [Watersipora subatra]|uniref:protein zyg-11 homolog B-like isoform X2 n=1 Tax=Watersipora subatra TaxID=2589382 RepID=UPI00355B0DB6